MVFGNTRTKMLIQKSETLWDNVLRQKYLNDLEREKNNESIRKKQRLETQDVIKKQIDGVNQARSLEKAQKAKDALEIKINYDQFLVEQKARETFLKDQQKMTASIYKDQMAQVDRIKSDEKKQIKRDLHNAVNRNKQF